jgi:hypothetical protein
MRAFSDFFSGLFESEEHLRSDEHQGGGLDGNSQHSLSGINGYSQHGFSSHGPAPGPSHSTLEVFDWQLDGSTPTSLYISESVAWAMKRHQRALILRSPDLSVNVEVLTYIWLRICVYKYIYVYIFMIINVNIHVKIWICIYICLNKCMCLSTYAHTYIYIYIYMFIYMYI